MLLSLLIQYENKNETILPIVTPITLTSCRMPRDDQYISMKTSLGKTLKDLLYHTKPILKHKDEEPIEAFYEKLTNYLNNSPPKREGKGGGGQFP